jgi:hypothetical protein
VAVVFIMLIINAVVRVIYLSYRKIKEWLSGNYDVGEQGELTKYDHNEPIRLPSSDRRI